MADRLLIALEKRPNGVGDMESLDLRVSIEEARLTRSDKSFRV